jgi:nitroimidazol reductase NimA-like FMN-containing flavoprotein (pyridoxamine 5'-phosphate oxidase superfamily)
MALAQISKIKEKQQLNVEVDNEHGTVYDNPLFTILDYREAVRKGQQPEVSHGAEEKGRS